MKSYFRLILPVIALSFLVLQTAPLGFAESASTSIDVDINSTQTTTVREQIQQTVQNTKEYREELSEKRDAVLTQAAENKEAIEAQKNTLLDKADEALNTIKTRLSTELDKALDHLSKLKNIISSSVGLSDSEKASALTEIDTYIGQVNTMKNQINNAESISDLRGIGQSSYELWKDYKQEHFKYLGLHLTGRFQNFLNQLSEIKTRLSTRLTELKQNHPDDDFSEVRTALTDFDTAISSAQTLITEAKTIFLSITEDSSSSVFQSGMDKLREAKKLLQTSHTELRTAIQETKIELTRTPE